MKSNRESILNSPKRLARIAGILYLIVAIFAAFAYHVFSSGYVAGEAAATTANVVASAGLIRMAVVAELIMATAWIFLAISLYHLLKQVHSGAALTMIIMVSIGAGIVCLNTVFGFEGMIIATESSFETVFGSAGLNALVLMLFDIQHYGGTFISLFYGLWLVPLGYLICKSGLFPRTLGLALIATCACYHAKLFTAILAPDLSLAIREYLSIPIWIFEFWMVLYLLSIGVRTNRPETNNPAEA